MSAADVREALSGHSDLLLQGRLLRGSLLPQPIGLLSGSLTFRNLACRTLLEKAVPPTHSGPFA